MGSPALHSSSAAGATPATANPLDTTRTLPARDSAIDVVRGVAILALILANFTAAAPASAFAHGDWDRITGIILRVLVSRKFYSLFSLLFGFSFVLFARSREARDNSFAWLWTRRMLVLLVIGYAHAIFIWPGDILREYARFGLLLPLFRKWPARPLFSAGAIALALSLTPVWYGPTQHLRVELANRLGPPPPPLDSVARAQGRADAIRTLRSGSYWSVVRQRAGVEMRKFRSDPFEQTVQFFAIEYFGLFLIGAAVAKRLLPDPQRHRRLLWKAVACGTAALPLMLYLDYRPLGIGTTWGPAWANTEVWGGASTLGDIIEVPVRTALALAYGAGLLLVCGSAAQRRRLAPVAAVGRMGLSNYLAQSAFFTTLVLGYGFGFWGVFTRFDTVLLSLGFFVIQMAGSTLWLRRFQYGPVEWLWRSLTYLRLQPMRSGRRATPLG